MSEDSEKIRVLFVCGSDFSGAEKSLLDLISSVADTVDPMVLVPFMGETYHVFTEKGIHCICHRFTDAWIPSGYLNNVLLHPWRLYTLKLLRYDIPCVRFVTKTLKGLHIDLIHTNYALTSFGVLLARKMKLPHVWHIREYLEKPYVNGRIALGRKWLRKQINGASARIVSSGSCRNYWQLTQVNTFTINDAVLHVDDSCYVKEKQPFVLFCSSVVSEAKGVYAALRAFGISGLGAKGIRLKVVGSASPEVEKQMRDIAVAYHCWNEVELISAQKNVKPLFANAMAFINPSRQEGMGRTTAEAMFFGCPVIARASGGTLDMIKHGETGWLFHTEEECAGLLRQICEQDQEQVIVRAQEFAKQKLSIDYYGEKIMEVYHHVLNT